MLKNSPISLQNLQDEITAVIENIPRQHARGTANDKIWTQTIKSEIAKIGKNHGFLVMPNETEPQWLFDLIWFKNNEHRHLQDLILVLESELSPDLWHIQEDFEKLLIAKAPLKVMLFQNRGENLQEAWELLQNGIQIFEKKSPDEIYILACFKEEPHEYEIKIITASEVG